MKYTFYNPYLYITTSKSKDNGDVQSVITDRWWPFAFLLITWQNTQKHHQIQNLYISNLFQFGGKDIINDRVPWYYVKFIPVPVFVN